MKLLLICLFAAICGAYVDALFDNRQRDWDEGYRYAVAQYGARKVEHDKIMRNVGLCKWARLMAEDIKCKTEQP